MSLAKIMCFHILKKNELLDFHILRVPWSIQCNLHELAYIPDDRPMWLKPVVNYKG
jgi:hypothetical protein